MATIARGAEAVIFLENFLGFTQVVKKIRVEKRYRVPHVDKTIRLHRTLSEARNMILAYKAGIPVPRVVDVDPYGYTIRIEYIPGETLRDLTARAIEDGDLGKVLSYYREAGIIVGKLHKIGIIHGDLSLTNFIVRSDGKLFIIDFGLSNRYNISNFELKEYLEACARDINVFLRNVEANFSNYAQELFNTFLKGYSEIVGQQAADRVVREIRRIRSLARYVVE